MKNVFWKGCLAVVGTLLPVIMQAQSMEGSVGQMHITLENIYNEMMPLCGDLVLVAQAIGGFGGLFYIGVRVWKHIAAAEAIDFFPLFRPFGLTILIGIFPLVLNLMNGILKPAVLATAEMVDKENTAVKALLKQRELTLSGDVNQVPLGTPNGSQDWNKYQQSGDNSNGSSSGLSFSFGLFQYGIMYYVKWFLSIVLQVLYYAASICIDVMRTFHLVILSILGPFVFAISIYDGFQQSLVTWAGRYLNIYMWLPISNLFEAMISKIQAGMLKLDIQQLQQGQPSAFSQTDAAYLIFLILAIVGYFSIPGIANYIVNGGTSSIMRRANALVSKGAKMMV